jgi:capsule polysaccharide export protein KpsE/RkpR
LEEIEKQEEIEHAKQIIRKAEEQIKAANEILTKYENKE